MSNLRFCVLLRDALILMYISTCELIKNLPPTITIKTLEIIDSCLRVERFSCSIDKLNVFSQPTMVKKYTAVQIFKDTLHSIDWDQANEEHHVLNQSVRYFSACVHVTEVTCKLHVNRNHWLSWHSVWRYLIQRSTLANVKIRSFDSLSFQYVYCNRLPNPTTKIVFPYQSCNLQEAFYIVFETLFWLIFVKSAKINLENNNMFGCQRSTWTTRVSGESTLRGDKLPFIQMYAFQFYIETIIC